MPVKQVPFLQCLMARKHTAAADVAEPEASLEAAQNTLSRVKKIPLARAVARG